MRLSILAAGTALLLASTAAMAQTPTPSANTPPAAQTDNQNSMQNSASGSLRGHVRDMLQSSGFTNIQVMPSSFMIRAKDKDGNPVVMSVSPDSVTEVSELGTSSGNSANGPVANEPAGSAAASGTSQFVSIGENDKLSSNLIGLDVYNSAKQDIGQIKDIAVGPQGRAQAYIMSVGGFLSMGEHYVAVNPNDVQVSYNTSDSKWHAMTNATTAELKAAPAFQYNGRWNASKS
jgi:PRC-barrel domain